MVRHIYPNFLEHRSTYQRAEEYWANLWRSIPHVREHQSDWKAPWMNTELRGGSRLNDGNPIFSAYSPSQMRGIRVIQYAPASDELEFDFWADQFGEGDDAIEELVISCALSDRAALEAFCLMSAWVAGSIEVRMDEGESRLVPALST